MPMRNLISLNPLCHFERIASPEEEEEEGGEYLFDPEAGKASDNPFAHLQLEAAPVMAATDMEVSKYVGGTEEE